MEQVKGKKDASERGFCDNISFVPCHAAFALCICMYWRKTHIGEVPAEPKKINCHTFVRIYFEALHRKASKAAKSTQPLVLYQISEAKGGTPEHQLIAICRHGRGTSKHSAAAECKNTNQAANTNYSLGTRAKGSQHSTHLYHLHGAGERVVHGG